MKRFVVIGVMFFSCIVPFFAAEGESSSVLANEIRAQEEQLLKRDTQSAEEEEKLRAKRSAQDNATIDKALEAFYAATEGFDYLPSTDEAKVSEALGQIEAVKQSISHLRELEDDTRDVEVLLKASLNESYDALEAGVYTTSSLDGSFTLRGNTYNRRKNAWTVSVYSTLLGNPSLFKTEFDISYEELTGRLFGPNSNMTKSQRQQFNDDVLIYDSFFRQALPFLYLRVTYTIQKWRNSSEYRFVPIRCEIYRSDNNRLVKAFMQTDMQGETFYMYPRVEVRTREERTADAAKASDVLEQEKEAVREAKKASAGEGSSDVSQDGRSLIFLTTDTRLTNKNLADFDVHDVLLNSVAINASFAIGKYGFAGGSLGYVYTENKNDGFCIGAFGGLTYRFGEFLRPFIGIDVDYYTNYTILAGGKVGADILIGHVAIVLDYTLSKTVYIGNYITSKDFSAEDDLYTSHIFSIGLGLSW